MRNHQSSTTVRKPNWSDKITSANATRNFGETVTLSKAELKSLLDAAIGQNPSPSGYIDFYNDCAYDVKNDDGEESGYPASLDASPAPDHTLPPTNHVEARITQKSNSVSNMTQSFPPGPPSESSSSKLEAKRRQWEREKEELVEWDPWGRPGGGAPRQRSQSLNHVPSASSSLPYVGRSAAASSLMRPNFQRRDPSKYSMRSSVGTAFSSQRMPDYIKSSLPFGPNSAHPSSDDNRELWTREDLARHNLRNDSITDVWYNQQSDMLTHTSYSGPLSPTQGHGSGSSHARGQGVFETDSNRAEKLQKAMEYRRFIEAQMLEKQRKQQEEKERKKREEEEEERRLEEERKRIQQQFEEEQRKIKEKEELEERKRLVLLEAVKNAQEAAETEKRAKRAQKRNQGKSSTQSIKPTSSSSPTHSIASSHKAKTEPKSPTTSTKTEEKVTPVSRSRQSEDEDVISAQELGSLQAWIRDDTKTNVNSPSETSSPAVVRLQQMATVHPIQQSANNQVPSTNLSPPSCSSSNASKITSEFGIQTEPSLSPYIQNRLLTPSQWRIKERLSRHCHVGMAPVNVWGCCRDMGTQTELRLNQATEWKGQQNHPQRRKVDHSDYAIGSSSSSCCSSAAVERSNPNKSKTNHSEEHRSESDALQTQSLTENNKPKWGVNKPSKNFVKMTERDPNCRRRKKLQEMRKQHWEKELATQKAMTQTKKMIAGSSSKQSYETQKRKDAPLHAENLGGTYTIPTPAQKVYARVPPVQTHNSRESAVVVLPPLSGRWSRSSDSLPNAVLREDNYDIRPTASNCVANGGYGDTRSRESRPATFEPPVRRKWHSQENFLPSAQPGESTGIVSQAITYQASNSEPLRHRDQYLFNPEAENDGATSDDAYDTAVAPTPRRKWSEQANFDLEKMTLLQAVFANRDFELSSNLRDTLDLETTTQKSSSKSSANQMASTMTNTQLRRGSMNSDDRDPLVNPNVITERPTPRQDKILQQLSTLRRGLLLKQQEIESRLQKSDPGPLDL